MKYKLDKQNITNILQVLAWSGVSAIVASAITIAQQIEVSGIYLYLVPVVNTLLYSIQQLLEENRPE